MAFTPENIVDFEPRLKGPFTMIIAGPTGCGKSQLVFKLIEGVHNLITPIVHDITYCYGQWQASFEKFKKTVQFHQGLLPRAELLEKRKDLTKHSLLIIDDLIDPEDAALVKDLFIKGSHHRNTSVIFITQNLFLPHKEYRTLSVNAHYIVIFKNPRDMSQIQAMARQAFPHNATFLTRVYNNETTREHSYILLDFKQATPDKLRVRGSITEPWSTPVFIPENKR